MASPVFAQTGGSARVQVILDNIWVFIAGVLVFFMQAGFALVEAGLTRAKNVGNIMMKNLMDCMAGVLAFALVGYSIGFGDEALGGWFSWMGIGIPGIEDAEGMSGYLNLSPATFFFFQAAFAATAATIVSGRHGRADEVQVVLRLLAGHHRAHLPGGPQLDLGRRLAGPAGVPVLRLRRLDHRPRHRRLGRPDGRASSSAPASASTAPTASPGPSPATTSPSWCWAR